MKRPVDVALGLVGLSLGALPLAMCAFWIKIVDGGPAFYRQWRVGRDGWLFRIVKLRTMRKDAEHQGGPQFARTCDPRILPGCRWMRRSHIDELPQLWNILLGQMSMVGPRPERPEMIQMLRPAVPRIDRRLVSRPGLTGLAQIRNGYTNDIAGARRKLAYDLRYMRDRRLVRDLQLLIRTVPKVFDRAGV